MTTGDVASSPVAVTTGDNHDTRRAARRPLSEAQEDISTGAIFHGTIRKISSANIVSIVRTDTLTDTGTWYRPYSIDILRACKRLAGDDVAVFHVVGDSLTKVTPVMPDLSHTSVPRGYGRWQHSVGAFEDSPSSAPISTSKAKPKQGASTQPHAFVVKNAAHLAARETVQRERGQAAMALAHAERHAADYDPERVCIDCRVMIHRTTKLVGQRCYICQKKEDIRAETRNETERAEHVAIPGGKKKAGKKHKSGRARQR